MLEEEKELSAPNWETAILLSSIKDNFTVQGRYHKMTDEIQIKLGKQIMSLYPQKVQAIALGDKVYIPSEYNFKERRCLGYFELLSEGEMTLLFRQEPSYNMTKNQLCYYYKSKNDVLARALKPESKRFEQVFKEHKNRISIFIKNHKLNPKKRRDLIKIFDYYNKLLGED